MVCPGSREKGMSKCRPEYLANNKCQGVLVLLRKHVSGLLVAEGDLVNGVSAVLERGVLAVDIGGEEDLCDMVSGRRSLRCTLFDVPGFHAKPWLEARYEIWLKLA